VKTVRYHEAAQNELLREIGYLELRAKGLGRRLLREVTRAETMIAEFPESGDEILPRIRKQVLQKFRFSLIYAMEEGEPLILALAHHSRRPGYWIGRVAGLGEGSEEET
jgi:hypothetical protein